MYEMGPAMFRRGLRVQVRIDVFHKGFFACRTHDEHVVLVHFPIEIFLGIRGKLLYETVYR